MLFAAGCAGSSPVDAGSAAGTIVSEPAAASPTASAGPTATAEPVPTTHVVATPVPSVDAQSDAASEGVARENAISDIADVDFHNGFTHFIEFEDEVAVTVEAGEFIDEQGSLWLWVLDVQYGDLTGDGLAEAVVHVGYNTGGSGQFGELTVWGVRDGDLVQLGSIGTGDRAHGGLANFELAGGALRTENFQSDQGACCPTMVTESAYVVGADGLFLAESSSFTRWMSVAGTDPGLGGDPLPELEFLPGTSSAVVAVGPGQASEALSFDASVGQWVTVTKRRGPETNLFISDDRGVIVDDSGIDRISEQLTASDGYTLHFEFGDVAFEERAVFDVLITAEPPPAPLEWGSTLYEVEVIEEPRTVLTWTRPDLSTTHPDADAALDAWLRSRVDWWGVDLVEYPPVDRDSDEPRPGGTYEGNYEITAIGDGLLSIRWLWYEYVCCRPYPNHGYEAAILDLERGVVIPVDELLDFGQLDAIHERWVEIAVAEEIIPEDYFTGYLDLDTFPRAAFSSAALTPFGVEVSTDRTGPYHATTTLLPWSDLDGIIDPDILARMSGAIVPARIGG